MITMRSRVSLDIRRGNIGALVGGEVIGMKLYTYIMLSTASLRFDQRMEVA